MKYPLHHDVRKLSWRNTTRGYTDKDTIPGYSIRYLNPSPDRTPEYYSLDLTLFGLLLTFGTESESYDYRFVQST